MAYNYNYKFWMVTSQDLNDLLLRQHVIKKLKPKGRLQAHDVFAEIYARYIILVDKLGFLFNQTFQVQKRAFIRRLLEAATKRLLELRNELKKLELSEFIYIDKILVQKKFIPQDIQLMRPFYFPYIRSDEIEDIINGPRIEESSDEWESVTSEEIEKGEDEADPSVPGDVIETVIVKPNRPSMKVAESTPKLLDEDEKKSQPKKKRRKKAKVVKQTESEKRLNYEKQLLTNSVKLIQAHERARRARVFLTNIKLHPDKYAPRPPELEAAIKYDFMHRPDQPMLILVKRTRYDADYFVEVKVKEHFDYYVKPKQKKQKIKASQVDINGQTQEKNALVEQYSFLEDILVGHRNSFHLLVEQEPNYAESYFWKGLLRAEAILPDIQQQSDIEIEDTPSVLSLKRRIRVEEAVRVIQRAWRAYKLKKVGRAYHLKRRILYGMLEERRPKKDINKEVKQEQRRRQKRKAWFDQQFIQACEDEKARILKVRGPWIMEDISDHIRAWFKEFYYGAGDFDRYPEEFQGGTILLVRGETMTLQEFIAKKSEKKKSKEEKKKEAEKRKAELAKKKEREKKERLLAKRKAELERKRGGFNLKTIVENPNVEELEKTMKEYKTEWEHIDEINNLKEVPYMEWISMDKFEEVYKELRIVVDNIMRIEFELLRQALAKDRKKKYKPQKKKKQKRKKKGKKKKKKGPKDLTEDRSIASLFYEMQDTGLITKYTRRNFDDFIGDYNYCAYEIRNFLEKDTAASPGEIKDILREWILGMGPLDLPKAKSICIAGPDSSGKNIILEVIATEVDAVLIDLSPEVVVRFEDKMPYLVHLVTKMARILQPTVISVTGIHKVFWKKIPKDQADIKPRLLAKYLIKKIVKPIKKEEKILFIGLTDAPWQAKGGQMKKCFEKFLLVPRVDYASSFLLWRSVALSMIGFPRDFEFSPIAMVTKNYRSGDICININNTLNIKRRLRFSQKPPTHMELLEGFLSDPDPLFPPKEAEYNKFIKWFTRVNKLAKQRVKYMKELEILREKEKSKEGKKMGK